MVLPQALNQLLKLPDWLAAAGDAARSGADQRLHDIVFEAMRFDPLAPGFRRRVLSDHILASGTRHARLIPAGASVLAASASAMMDDRHVSHPGRFDPDRPPDHAMHFGHGLHECFGRHINHATLHRILKPLLAQAALRRALGRAGQLRKRGVFADHLEIMFD